MDEAINRLRNLCDEVVADPVLQPLNGKTFCNVAVNRICHGMGYNGFTGLVANEIYDICFVAWSRVNGEWASEYACSGGLALAAWKNPNGHGHVTIIYPGKPVWSKKWNASAPLVANVGKENKVFGANFAFVDEPDYFVLKS